MTDKHQIEEITKVLCADYGDCEDCPFAVHFAEYSTCDKKEQAERIVTEKGYRKVERGEWKPYPKIKGKVTPEAVCSLCGCMCVYLLVNDRYELAHYCPKCGADMRQRKEDEGK